MKVCAVPECPEKTSARDLCRNHYQKFARLKKNDGIEVQPEFLDLKPAAIRAMHKLNPESERSVEEKFFWERLSVAKKFIEPNQE